MTDDAATPENRFEFGAAVALGLAAVMSAWAAHQSGLWGGNCLTAYSEAGQQTTHAATEYQEAGAVVIRDSALDIQAKQIVVEAQAMEEGPAREAKMTIARYLYTQQMSDAAYAQLQLPAQFRNEDTWDQLPEAALLASLDQDISDEYWNSQLDSADQEFGRAQLKFTEGRQANAHGDAYGFANVLLTISMFFSGISLVFKSSARWALLGLGVLTLVTAGIFMVTLPFAGWGVGASDPPPAESPATEPTADEPAAPSPAPGIASPPPSAPTATEEAAGDAIGEPEPSAPSAEAPSADAEEELEGEPEGEEEEE